jgi:signal transduction histidine kinase
VPLAAGQAVYRVVQEALANSARHAPGSAVAVAVVARPDGLHLSVVNGPPPSVSRVWQ